MEKNEGGRKEKLRGLFMPKKQIFANKEWWQFLDWSTMNMTYEMLTQEWKDKIFQEGYWSKGKGKFSKRVMKNE